MTTYQRGREPAGSPVTWEFDNWTKRFTLWDRHGEIVANKVWASLESIESICAAFHAAAEWRKLAEDMESLLKTAPLAPHGTTEWRRRFTAAKERFHE